MKASNRGKKSPPVAPFSVNPKPKKAKPKGITEQTRGIIRQQLAYKKAGRAGKQLVQAGPKNISTTCCRCKTVEPGNRRGKTYSCQRCGLNLDANLDAATNI